MTETVPHHDSIQTIIMILAVSVVAACSVSTASPATRASSQGALVTGPPIASTHVEPAPTVFPSATVVPTPIPVAESLSSNSFKLPVVIQHLTDKSAELYFELSEPADGLVIYQVAQNGSQQQIMSFDSSAAAHQILLPELSAGTGYRAVVVLNGADNQYHQPGFLNMPWGDVSFRTWSDRQPLKFGLIGDSGFGDPVTPRLAAQMATHGLDFAIVAGDIVYKVGDNHDPYEAFALKYYQPLSAILHQMPLYPVVGNHDEERATVWNGLPFYYHAFPAFADPRFEPSTVDGRNQWYAFAYGPVQFIMLDTQAFYDEKERADQQAWLAERLADKRFTTSIPVFHIPPYSAGLHDSDGLPVISDWQPLFEQAGVRLVLSGHDHNYQRLLVNGITYVVSGGGSATLYRQTQVLPQSQVFVQQSHFVQFEVYPDRIALTAQALGGDVIDQASIALY